MSGDAKSAPLAQRPSGVAGRLFGRVMEWMNGGAYRRALEVLQPAAGERFLELGFGTGRFLEMLLAEEDGCFAAGLDPTPTMVDVAASRLQGAELDDRADLRIGDDRELPWGDGGFHAVVAIHSFQFWRAPERSVAEVRRVLRPRGRLLLVLRDHSRRAPAWLPNPLSRSGREVEAAHELLVAAGFLVTEHSPAGTSRVLLGLRRD